MNQKNIHYLAVRKDGRIVIIDIDGCLVREITNLSDGEQT